MIRRLLITCSILVWGSVTYGDVKFKYQILEEEPSPLLNSFHFEFPFENDSSSSFEIIDVSSSCSCVLPELKKRIYAPREKGLLNGEVYVAGKTGAFHQSIIVKTDSLKDPIIKLSIKLNIQPFAKIKPNLLFWRLNETPAPKITSMHLNPEFSKEISNVTTDNDNFTIDLIEDSKNRFNFEIKITPKSTIENSRAIISFSIKASDGTIKKHFIHAMIK